MEMRVLLLMALHPISEEKGVKDLRIAFTMVLGPDKSLYTTLLGWLAHSRREAAESDLLPGRIDLFDVPLHCSIQ